MTEKYAGDSARKASQLPQPPKGYAPQQDEVGRPPCARCVREGGIVLYGRRHPPNRSDIHPDHTSPKHGERGGIVGFNHKGPREPLCSHHVELVAWEGKGGNRGVAKPAWAAGARPGGLTMTSDSRSGGRVDL